MKTALVGLLYVGLALASPVVVRESRSLYGDGLVAQGPGVVAPVAPVAVGPAHYLAAGYLSSQAILANLLASVPAPPVAPVAPVAEPDYDEGYGGGADYADLAATAPPLYAGPGEVLSAATFPPIDPPASTPAPLAPAAPTLAGPVVPPLVIKGPSGTIRSGPLSTGAVSLAGHVAGHY
ncbi:hypothetical protein H0H92_015922 [Tricholoma furcatifolium]|nr:hypothetical protein H0H92_015922 [Tricholoma furcatifolium]